MLIGLAFDPAATANDLVLWVTHSAYAFSGGPDWTGKVTRLSGPNLATVQDYVIGLPRSARDHLTNSLAFGPDGAIYFVQGSNSAMGASDAAWENRPVRPPRGTPRAMTSSRTAAGSCNRSPYRSRSCVMR